MKCPNDAVAARRRALLRRKLSSAEVPLVARLALVIRRKWCEQIFDHGKTCATVVAPSREWLTTAAAFAHSTANTNIDKPSRRR